jgi:hypothetical protein
MTDTTRWVPRAIIALGLVVLALYVIGWAPGFRPALAVAFLLICPGLALVRLLRPGDMWEELTLGIALSIALSTAVATVLVYAVGNLHPALVLVVLVAVSSGAAAYELGHPAPREAA